MTLRNTRDTYGSVSKILHWLIGLSILAMLILGVVMGHIEKPLRFQVYTIHKDIGLTLLALVIIRIFWTLANPKPRLPKGSNKAEHAAAHLSHFVLYLLILGMPLSGWIMSCAAGHIPGYFGLFKVAFPGIVKNKPLAGLASNFHYYIAWSILAVVIVHVLAAIKHHWINRDNILVRMLPGRKN